MKKLYILSLIALSFIFLSGFKLFCTQQKKADLIIFSYNRPMQLYALLESIEKYTTGLDKTFIIYRSSNALYEKGYSIVRQQFPNHYYMSQGGNPQADFKPLTVQALHKAKNEYILFAVDDMIIKDTVDLSDCINALEKYNGYGFYLRLGKNLNACYPYNNAYQPLPAFQEVEDDKLKWQFIHSSHDWHYLHTVDMTLYNKKHISSLISSMQFTSPNKLEAQLSLLASQFLNHYGLCYIESKVVNIPLNRVQNDWSNKHMNFIQPSELLELFLSDKKIDISLLEKINNPSAHLEFEPTFIMRS